MSKITPLVLVAATGNKHKIDEISAVTAAFGISLRSRSAAGLPDIDPEETGSTFEENAYLKAYAAMRAAGMPAIADDSGLVVDALDGAPGVYSARFGTADEANNEKLLRLMKDVPDAARTARFVCVITILWPDGRKIVCDGVCEGHIAHEPAGENGFGYDPLFIPAEYDSGADDVRTFAQLTPDEKNGISHRAKALLKLQAALEQQDAFGAESQPS
ncbi:MAG: RdgB/HAM1 family non-canonical purine NTP pyrophosphatase [Clostridiales Family XIII bacterium]|jgi:XTP/dITP diphosphohydrolase|nr:RdgB/HAM1 family non-canonical purine NTP pyrophosphatase [Clostridiales Family XIII bacterium]